MLARGTFKLASTILAAVVLAASCGTAEVLSEQQASQTSAPTSQESESTGGQASPDAVLVDLSHGGQLDWNTLQGQDVMLWFWAPW